MDGHPNARCAEGDAHVGLPSARLWQRSRRRRGGKLSAPDRKALEKAANLLAVQTRAQDMMMDAASEGDERVAPLSSRVTDIRGYPAIIAESKRTNRGKASFVMRGELFVGLIKVRLVSSSGDRAEAKRNFDEFVAAMEILDVAPGESAPAADPPPPPTPGADRT